eukprot:TRINITY_DN41656_c0_g1_i2.p2 TRINITY_DN41656_c0_g1~~TRINITY_DN41656_c0_g1_i2.p2  ORF type:complete len:363 (+),score=88.43 TRINITY_DN41656_c0_g1_i2:349-1437(+)
MRPTAYILGGYKCGTTAMWYCATGGALSGDPMRRPYPLTVMPEALKPPERQGLFPAQRARHWRSARELYTALRFGSGPWPWGGDERCRRDPQKEWNNPRGSKWPPVEQASPRWVLFDGTPWYLLSATALASAVAAHSTAALRRRVRLALGWRDPIVRARSHFAMVWSWGWIPRSSGFAQMMLRQVAALRQCDQRLADAPASLIFTGGRWGADGDGGGAEGAELRSVVGRCLAANAMPQLLPSSLPAAGLGMWLRYFDGEQVTVFRTDSALSRPLDEVLRTLGSAFALRPMAPPCGTGKLSGCTPRVAHEAAAAVCRLRAQAQSHKVNITLGDADEAALRAFFDPHEAAMRRLTAERGVRVVD